MKNCTKCGEINTTDTKYCVRCGNDTFVSDDDVVCPKCGMANTTESAYCIGCGEPLPAKDGRVSVSVKTTAQMPAPIVSEPVEDGSVCVVCGAKIRMNDVFCTNCGSVVADSAKNKIVKKRLCPKCGKPNDLISRYCGYCFTELEGGDIEEYSLDFIETAVSGGQDVKQAVLVSAGGKKSRICPNCGTVNDFDESYCVKCGCKLFVDIAKKYCLVCGTENNYDAKFCVKCQYAFSGRAFGQMQGSWKCSSCGELNESESNFCSKCGAKRPKR